MPDIFLYQGEANPADIKLSDPTVLRSAGGAPPVTGTLASTLSDATMAATATETISGTLSATLADATLAAQMLETISGTLASTLGNATLAITATETISGTLASTLGNATADIQMRETMAGTLASTLSNATLAMTAFETISGPLAATLGNATLSADALAANPVSGTLEATLGSATLSIVGSEQFTGTLNSSLSPATLAATGALQISGALGATLGDATLAASGGSYFIEVGSTEITHTQRGNHKLTVNVVRVLWITDSSGEVSFAIPKVYGSILKIVTTPSATFPPMVGYNIALIGEDNIDIMGSAANGLDSTNKEEIYPTLNGSVSPAFACGASTIRIYSTGGIASGIAVLYFTESLGGFSACA